MYIKNSSMVNKKIPFNKSIAKYLIKNKIPLLSQEDGIFYFAETEELRNKLDEMPWYLKLLK